MYTIEMDAGAEQIIRRLEEAGYEAYIVGGCVRDSLMGKVPKDWDITTSAVPKEIKEVFHRTFDTGIAHGTVSVRELGETYEVTTYRIDGGYADHRRPDSVQFTASLREDLARRDFTINAMAYHPERGLVDYFDGCRDLGEKRVRCVGDPEQRFEEDALRMMRALRFSARLGFSVDRPTYEAIITKSDLLKNISKERIEEELNQILLSPHPEYIRDIWRTGLMPWCVPVFEGGTFEYEWIRKVPAERILRWAMFLKDLTPEQTDVALRDLKFDNASRIRICRLAAFRSETLPTGAEVMRRFLHRLGRENFEDLYAYQLALGYDPTEAERAWAMYLEQKDCCLEIAELALGGRDLIAAGIPAGPGLGAALEEMLDAVLADPSRNTAEQLRTMIGDE